MDSKSHSGLTNSTPFERANSNNCCSTTLSYARISLHKTIVNIESFEFDVIGKLSSTEPWHNLINDINSCFD